MKLKLKLKLKLKILLFSIQRATSKKQQATSRFQEKDFKEAVLLAISMPIRLCVYVTYNRGGV